MEKYIVLLKVAIVGGRLSLRPPGNFFFFGGGASPP